MVHFFLASGIFGAEFLLKLKEGSDSKLCELVATIFVIRVAGSMSSVSTNEARLHVEMGKESRKVDIGGKERML